MDTAVALVQDYVHVNGYFTVAEHPVLEADRGDHPRTVTDLDIPAVRFAGAGHEVIRGRSGQHPFERCLETDPILRCPTDRPDMIVGEVKEGAAQAFGVLAPLEKGGANGRAEPSFNEQQRRRNRGHMRVR
jgi:hypothetical protein